MSSALYDGIARIARHEAQARSVAGVGRVTETFTGAQSDHAVTVEMRDTGLVLPRVPVAVGVLGYAAIPAVDDLVLVIFADGDVNAGVVAGRLYHPDLPAPDHADGQLVLRLPPTDPSVNLEITASTPTITLGVGEDVMITVNADEATVTVAEMTITATTAGGGRAEVAAGGASLVLKKDGDITLSTSGKLTLEGSEVAISGSGKVKVTGGTVEIN